MQATEPSQPPVEPRDASGRAGRTPNGVGPATAAGGDGNADEIPSPFAPLVSLMPPVDTGPSRSDRAIAALGYICALGMLSFPILPGRQFMLRHNRVAVTVHFIRFVWIGGTLAVWWALAGDGAADQRGTHVFIDLGMLALVGVPWISTFSTDALPWIAAPLAVTWVLSIAGFVLAVAGRTFDLGAATRADWSDIDVRRRWLWRSPEEERRLARSARDRQLERLQQTTRRISTERVRRDHITELEDEIDRLTAERGHADQLLASGEISRKRYDLLYQEIESEVAALRSQLHELTTRVAMPGAVMPSRLRVNRLGRGSESRVNTIALVTPDGLPLFTYGHFQLDEALVAGILSAFDSLTEEVFGSRVHKTELAEGQVMYFARGEFVVILSVFAEEPSPHQIQQLRTMVKQFESANHGPLARGAWDPKYLHEVPVPFRFDERLPRGM